MSVSKFQLGQRWVSNTEPELGLGVIVDDGAENELGRITVNFPAAKERRTYAFDNAPLHRVQFQVGDEIKSAQGVSLTVTDSAEQMGYIVYLGVDEEGNELTLPELELNSYVRFSRPQDRLLAGQIDKLSWFSLRYKALQHRNILNRSSVRGLLGPRIQLLPHQLFIANEVAGRYAPRVLLADEVGLGKTIEAGLVIHQQLCTGHAQRVLVVVPETLIHQWLVEMLRRFNLQFTVLDEDRCQALEESCDNPFESTQLVLLSSEFLSAQESRLAQALDTQWDLLVVDEAHHLVWEDKPEAEHSSEGQAYRCIEQLSQRSQGLLLLTATPEQLGVSSHFARLRLLDPDRYFDFDKYCEEESGYQQCNDLVAALHSDDIVEKLNTDKDFVSKLEQFIGDKVTQLQQASTDADTLATAIEDCVDHLLDHHGTGRVLFRNTRGAIAGFPKRVLHPHPLSLDQSISTDADPSNLDQLLHPELAAPSNWCESDPRVAWVLQWIKQNRNEKAVLICRELNTCQSLEDYLRYKKGARTAAFHQELSLLQRARAAAYFADDIDGAQVLICSEIGSEGRNFQFAHHLILFDLPLNPDLLEQRIGRLARIGQTENVNIHAPYFENSAHERLLQWYQQGLNAIEEPCPAAQVLYENNKETLHTLLVSNDDSAWQTFLDKVQTETQDTLAQLDQGRNRLLELNSCRPQAAKHIVDTIAEHDQNSQLRKFMTKVFDAYGVDEDYHSENSIVIHPGNHMQNDHFPYLTDEGLTATFDRDTALSREDIHFLTWEHPMVNQVLDMILHGESGNTAVGTMKLPPLKPGTLLIEAIYVLHCPCPKELQVDRYFSDSLFRWVLDEKNDLSKVINYQQLSALVKPAPDKRTAQEIVKRAKAEINALIQRSQKLADAEQQQLIDAALTKMQAGLGHELERLQTLAAINPNIRPQEIEHLQQQIETLADTIKQTQLSLDMVRIIVCV